MTEAVYELLKTVCFLIIIVIIAGISVFILLNRQAHVIKTVNVQADSVEKNRRKYLKTVRIALISDLHIPCMPPSKEAVISKIESGAPDYVVIAGDLCNEKKRWQEAAAFVKEIAERTDCRIFIVFGNHDIDDACGKKSSYIKEYRRILENCDSRVTVLADECIVTECAGTQRKFLFGGLNDYRHSDAENGKRICRQWKNKADDNEADFVLIAHNPDSCEVVEEGCEPQIALFGHTHGGQMWMPFNFEFRFLRKDKLPRKGYKYGLKLYEGRFPIYITSGIGCTFLPIRFRTSAETVFIDI